MTTMSTSPTWQRPSCNYRSDFSFELEFVNDLCPAVRATAREPFITISKMNAAPRLFRLLDKLAPLVAAPGLDGPPDFFRAPSGIDHRVGIVLGCDKSATLHVIGTNYLHKLELSRPSTTSNFFSEYAALDNDEQKTMYIWKAICAAIKQSDFNLINCVEREGTRYRTMPVYLLVIDGVKTHFFATTAIVDGSRRCNGPKESVCMS